MENQTMAETAAAKNMAIIAYITLIGLIIAIVMNNEKRNTFAAWHIRQSLGLMCTGFALAIINVVPILGWLVSIIGTVCIMVLWLFGLLNAVNGKEAAVPLLGNLYNKWFAGVK